MRNEKGASNNEQLTMKREEGRKSDDERETSRGQETYKREGRKARMKREK
jgi:hypothetical protein